MSLQRILVVACALRRRRRSSVVQRNGGGRVVVPRRLAGRLPRKRGGGNLRRRTARELPGTVGDYEFHMYPDRVDSMSNGSIETEVRRRREHINGADPAGRGSVSEHAVPRFARPGTRNPRSIAASCWPSSMACRRDRVRPPW